MKKIIFGITSLDCGGAERVLVDIVNELSNKYDITIFTIYGKGKFEKELNPNIKLIQMYKEAYFEINKIRKLYISLSMILPFLRKKILNKYIYDNYDISVAFLEGPVTWLFSEVKNTKYAWIHNDIIDVFGNNKKSSYKQKLNMKSYKVYDKLIFVSNDNLQKFNSAFPENKVDKYVIHNYLNSKNVISKSEEELIELEKNSIDIVQVSRLVTQKGIERLINAHKKVLELGFKHNIYVIGDGPLKENLQSKIKEFNVEDTFKLLGQKTNPYPYIKASDYFILTSLYEGYGMVIEEAKILNKYIMITNTAAREAVEDYQWSMIVDNTEDGIINGIIELIKNDYQCNQQYKFNNQYIIKDIVKLIEGE